MPLRAVVQNAASQLGAEMTELNDQHAYLRWDPAARPARASHRARLFCARKHTGIISRNIVHLRLKYAPDELKQSVRLPSTPVRMNN